MRTFALFCGGVSFIFFFLLLLTFFIESLGKEPVVAGYISEISYNKFTDKTEITLMNNRLDNKQYDTLWLILDGRFKNPDSYDKDIVRNQTLYLNSVDNRTGYFGRGYILSIYHGYPVYCLFRECLVRYKTATSPEYTSTFHVGFLNRLEEQDGRTVIIPDNGKPIKVNGVFDFTPYQGAEKSEITIKTERHYHGKNDVFYCLPFKCLPVNTDKE